MKKNSMKKTMNYTNLGLDDKQIKTLKELDKIKNGAYFIIQYYTDCNSKVAASFKYYNVTKLTTMSVRKGVDYKKTKAAIQKTTNNLNNTSIKSSWFSHVAGSKTLLKHTTKNQYYIALFPNKFGKATTQYFINGKPISKEELMKKGIMQPSFWSNKNTSCDFFTLGIDKVYKIIQNKH